MMAIKNLSVGKKIILGFSVQILFFFASALWMQLAVTSIADHLQHIKDESAAFALLAKDMEKADNALKSETARNQTKSTP